MNQELCCFCLKANTVFPPCALWSAEFYSQPIPRYCPRLATSQICVISQELWRHQGPSTSGCWAGSSVLHLHRHPGPPDAPGRWSAGAGTCRNKALQCRHGAGGFTLKLLQEQAGLVGFTLAPDFAYSYQNPTCRKENKAIFNFRGSINNIATAQRTKVFPVTEREPYPRLAFSAPWSWPTPCTLGTVLPTLSRREELRPRSERCCPGPAQQIWAGQRRSCRSMPRPRRRPAAAHAVTEMPGELPPCCGRTESHSPSRAGSSDNSKRIIQFF